MSWCNVKTSLMLSQRNVDRFPPLLSIRLSVSWPLMKLTLFVSRKADDEPLCHAQLVSEAGERPKNPRASVWSQLPRTARAAQEQTVRTRNVRVFFSFTIAVYDINNLFKHSVDPKLNSHAFCAVISACWCHFGAVVLSCIISLITITENVASDSSHPTETSAV